MGRKKPYMVRNSHKPESETIRGYAGPIVCRVCKEEKERSEYYASNLAGNERMCKACNRAYVKEKFKDVNYLIDSIYNKHAYAARRAGVVLGYSREEFFRWVNGQRKFFELYRIWIEDGCIAGDRPTVCRINIRVPHGMGNLKVVTVRESRLNPVKGKARPVGKYLDGMLVEGYSGVWAAIRAENGSSRHIVACLRGDERTYRGYEWRYLDMERVREGVYAAG